MKIVFLGATKFSEEILGHLLQKEISVEAIFTIPIEFNISYSAEKVRNYNFADLVSLAEKNHIPSYQVTSEKGKKLSDFYSAIEKIKPDVILVIGWYFMVPKKIRILAKHGAWGIHASLLPSYAGGAPLVWAIINGEKETGTTLFRLDEGVDSGDIIAQEKIVIGDLDTIKEIYDKVTEASKRILLESLLAADSIQYMPQPKSDIKIYPQRKPSDGEIDLTLPGWEMYNFIRAQVPPYPGAFIRTIDGKKIIIDKVRLEP